jgi:uroporphyrinogen decarboxylase
MHDRFLRACRREPTDVTPVWFMRQAGRYMPEYLELRKKHTLLDICANPELALEVTLQPLKFGFDAAILFADILLPIAPMGAPFEFVKGEGPVVHTPIRSRADVEKLIICDPEEHLGHVLEAVRLIRRELDGKTPLIGFAGAPFTVASYLIEGGKSSNYLLSKKLMWSEPDTWNLLMHKVVQDYREFVKPHVSKILADVSTLGVPVLHFGTGTNHLLEEQCEAGGSVIGVDWRQPLDVAWKRIGDRAIQGNLDPLLLLAPRDVAVKRAQQVLERAAGRPGHIFNLGHGIVPQTPTDTVKAVIDAVHEWNAG